MEQGRHGDAGLRIERKERISEHRTKILGRIERDRLNSSRTRSKNSTDSEISETSWESMDSNASTATYLTDFRAKHGMRPSRSASLLTDLSDDKFKTLVPPEASGCTAELSSVGPATPKPCARILDYDFEPMTHMPQALNYGAHYGELRETWAAHENFDKSLAYKIVEFHDNFRESCKMLGLQADAMQTYGDSAHKEIAQHYPWVKMSAECHLSCEKRRHARLANFNNGKTQYLEGQHADLAHRQVVIEAVLRAKPKSQEQREAFVRDLKHEIRGWAIAFKNHLQDEETIFVPVFLDMGQWYLE